MEGQEVRRGHLNLVCKAQFYYRFGIGNPSHKANICMDGGAGQEAGGEEVAIGKLPI